LPITGTGGNNMSKQYEISRMIGQCGACEKSLSPGEEFFAIVTDGEEELLREDFCIDCWEKRRGDSPAALALWRTRVPQQKEKKRLFVDDELLKDFFRRLDGADDEAKISFRFVLALVLMRKKLLVYDRAETNADGQETWAMHFRGSDEHHSVTDPHMDEDSIADVSRQLGAILEGEV